MAICFNETTVPALAAGEGALRQRLLSSDRFADTDIVLDRLVLSAGARLAVEVPRANLAWFLMLGGEATLASANRSEALSDAHAAFLPPGYRATLAAEKGATLIWAEIPDAQRFDPEFNARPPAFRLVDWTREPVLNSEHDARRRIYLATPKLFGTTAIRGEMILYPPGTSAPDHHHEGAEHFMYFLRGRGTAWANGKPFDVHQGDVVWYADRERHYLKAASDDEMVFAEFFVPGNYKTIWADPSQVCTWLPTGRDIKGRTPAREIMPHSSADFAVPADV